jgi:serine/threonine protein kinase
MFCHRSTVQRSFRFYPSSGRLRRKKCMIIHLPDCCFIRSYRARPPTVPLNSKCDLWSLGVVAYMLLSSRMPFVGRDMREMASAILWSEIGFIGYRWRDVSERGRDFVASLLERDASSRPTADDAIRHPWLERSFSSLSAASKKKEDGNGRENRNDGNSDRIFNRRNSSGSVGGTALLPSSLHGTKNGRSPGRVALESRILDSIENYSTYSWMVS